MHERTYLREQLKSSVAAYRLKVDEAHALAQKKKRFFLQNKQREHELSQAQHDFADFETQLARVLEALDKHVAVDAPASGTLVNIDSLGLI